MGLSPTSKRTPIFRHPVIASAIAAVVVCLAAAGVKSSGLLDQIELQGFDLLVSSQALPPPCAAIIIVDFDDASVNALNAFPIPRQLLANVIEKVSAGAPALIGLDVLLDKKREPVDDQKLASAIGDAGNVILAENFGTDAIPAAEPLEEFHQRALDVAFVNLPIDKDGFIRRMYLFMRMPGFAGLSFPALLASNYLQRPLERGLPGNYRIGQSEIFTYRDDPSTALVGFWPTSPARVVPVQDLLARDFDPGIFQGRIVLVGQSSSAAKDLYATPVFRFRRPREGREMLSGTEIHAAAIAALLAGKTIHVLGRLPFWILTFAAVWLLVGIVISVRPLYGVLAVIGGILGSYLLALFLLSGHQWWMRFVTTEAGIVFTLPAGLGYRYVEERRLKSFVEAERRELMSLFERYVSPEVAAEIWDRRHEIVLAGEEKTATVLFSDIRNFTAITAGKPSAEVLAWLNDYFNAMSEVIKKNGGFLNKFIGDGMLVVFGVPLSEGPEKDACRGVRAALEMIERVEALNAEPTPGRPPLRIGIGLHTGPLTAGNVGARDRLEYSVIGETVNLASRLEALTKDFGRSPVMSPQTQELVRNNFETEPLGEAKVRGFPESIRVYTVRR